MISKAALIQKLKIKSSWLVVGFNTRLEPNVQLGRYGGCYKELVFKKSFFVTIPTY